MFLKFGIIILLLIILYCLGSALFFMLRGKTSDTQMVKALTWRVALSLFVFFLLMLGYFMGWLHPHG